LEEERDLNSKHLLNKIGRMSNELNPDKWETWDKTQQKNITRKEFLDILGETESENHIKIPSMHQIELLREEVLSRPEKIKTPLGFAFDEIKEILDKLEDTEDKVIELNTKIQEQENFIKIVQEDNIELKKEIIELKKENNNKDELLEFLCNHAEQIPEFKDKLKRESVKGEIVEVPKKKKERIEF